MNLYIEVPEKFRELYTTEKRYYVYYGGRGSGKSYAVATYLILKAYTTPNLKVLCCREIQKSINDSVLSLLKDLIDKMGLSSFFDVQRTQILGKNGSRFMFAGLRSNPDSVKSIANVSIAWVEEAATLSQESVDILLPSIRAPNSKIIFTLNPNTVLDPVYNMFCVNPPDNCVSVKVNWYDNPYFGTELEEERLNCLKTRSEQIYAHIWDGVPISDNENAFINPIYLRACIDAHLKLNFITKGNKKVGFDVSDSGSDDSAVAFVHGSILQAVKSWHGVDVITNTDIALEFARLHGAEKVVFDSIGVGAGVTAYAKRLPTKIRFQGWNAGSAVENPEKEYMQGKKNKDHFANAKAQAWQNLADRVYKTYRAVKFGDEYSATELISISSEIEDLESLLAELSAPELEFDGAGRIKVESKESMKRRGIKSPNMADAVVMSFINPRQKQSYFNA